MSTMSRTPVITQNAFNALQWERQRRWAPRVANYLANGKNARSTLMNWGGQLPTAHQFDGCEAWIRGMCRLLLTHLSIHALSPCNIPEHARATNEMNEESERTAIRTKNGEKNSIQFDCDTLINFVPNQLLSGHCSNDNDDISQASKQLTIACHRKWQRQPRIWCLCVNPNFIACSFGKCPPINWTHTKAAIRMKRETTDPPLASSSIKRIESLQSNEKRRVNRTFYQMLIECNRLPLLFVSNGRTHFLHARRPYPIHLECIFYARK